ncbi:hypothetical protein EKO04_002854 [Ascochyta lentis]|uniref:DUF3669 domain-containing protein n=1 Tax=Ascochyta lentis TaxID=205686 RepID=A0A8H7MFW9_9PLEO|nr:hypothetical protein EKO04_002854 [Ascochyta lentis]
MLSDEIQYRCIGRGFCGSVWALEDSQNAALTAVKREDGGPGRSVTNDYNMHLRILRSASQYQITTPLSIPQCHQLIKSTDAWWETRLPQFPTGYSACRALISERIPKVPRQVSDKLVDLFCPDNKPLADFVKDNPDDSSCLLRPYLGRRRRHQQGGATASRFQRFSLRNVPLHVDQMEELGLDIKLYATAMAGALALMHWGAEVDANDVEFVLAPPQTTESGRQPAFESDYLGTHSIWILDFDCCGSLSMDDTGVEQACKAFFKNDPFYPRPGSGRAADDELWNVFKQQFMLTSRIILEQKGTDDVSLAEKLLQRIEEEGVARSRNKKALA